MMYISKDILDSLNLTAEIDSSKVPFGAILDNVTFLRGAQSVPIKVFVSVRNTHNNQMLQDNDGEFYFDCSSKSKLAMSGFDYIMLSCKEFLEDKLVEPPTPELIRFTALHPMGCALIGKSSSKFVAVYMHIIFEDRLLNKGRNPFKDELKLTYISDYIKAYSPKDSFQESCLKKMIVVKEGAIKNG